MLSAVFIGLAVLGTIVLLLVLLVQRGRDGVDLSLGGLLRVYLYFASLAGVIAFAIGLGAIISYVLAAAFGLDLVYGGQIPRPEPAIAPFCAPNTTCPPFVTHFPQQALPDPRVRQQTEDLVRGATFVVFGAVFWAAHWWARRALAAVADRASALHRAYLILGTAIFGIATIVFLPVGIYQALSFAVVPADQFSFRSGAGEALSGGLAALPLWLAYLWLVRRALRGDNHAYAAGPGGSPPPEPAPVGARTGPGPSSRSAGAEATPPEKRN
jgi:hypothetical protein